MKDKNHTKFKLIYCGIVEKPEEYESLKRIIDKFKLSKEDVIFDGSTTLLELEDTFVRWIVIKA